MIQSQNNAVILAEALILKHDVLQALGATFHAHLDSFEQMEGDYTLTRRLKLSYPDGSELWCTLIEQKLKTSKKVFDSLRG